VSETKTAKLFTHGRSQAVRLPKEFRLPGKEVRVSRVGHRVILEPIARSPDDVAAVFAEIDRLLLAGEPFPMSGRRTIRLSRLTRAPSSTHEVPGQERRHRGAQ
jgi:antitoxin VapB